MRNTGSIIWKSWPLALMPAIMTMVAPAQTGITPSVVLVEGVSNPVFIAAGDLNGDGKLDLAVAAFSLTNRPKPEYQGHVFFFFQKNGAYAWPADREIRAPVIPSGLVLADFDGDGKNDLAVGLRNRRTLALYLGGESYDKAHLSAYANDGGAGSLSAGRINRRGLADFMTGLTWRKWIKDDQFECAYFSGPKRNDNRFSTLADIDGNGSDDVIFTSWGSDTPQGENNLIRIYYGPFFHQNRIAATDAAGIVTLTSPFTNDSKPILGQVLVGDLNADGQPDLVAGGSGRTLVYFQNNPTGFSDQAGPSLTLKGLLPLLAADLDGDKLCDLVLLSEDGKTVSIWRQRAEKPLTAAGGAESITAALPRRAVVAAAGDMDGDGRKEIFVALERGGLAVIRTLN
ncbi:MAG: VCBS repeat-containing protein [Kiritimatiellae bacterium]|nr:VCBS repeat-containing protein [Kiritimatiellia bacterium]